MASQLDHREFVGNPSIEELKTKKVTKDQLKYIAQSFGVPFTSEHRKDSLLTHSYSFGGRK